MTRPHPHRRAFRPWLSLGLLLAAIVMITAVSCRTGAPPPSLQPSAPSLDATRDRAVAVDRAEVDRFLDLFRSFEPDALATAAPTLYADDVRFNDGFVELQGVDAVVAYLVRSAEHVAELGVELQDVAFHDAEVYVRWEMVYVTGRGRRTVAPGISHLRFGADGRIVYHRDYWDASGALAMHVAPAAAILRAVRNRL